VTSFVRYFNQNQQLIIESCVYCCVIVGLVLMETVKAADGKDCVVNITGLRASQRYLVTVESRCASGISCTDNSSLSVTTLTNVTATVLCTVIATLAAVLLLSVIAAAVCSIYR